MGPEFEPGFHQSVSNWSSGHFTLRRKSFITICLLLKYAATHVHAVSICVLFLNGN